MKDQWFSDVSWNMYEAGEYVYDRVERELAIDENDSDFIREMKTEKYNVYFNSYIIPNLLHCPQIEASKFMRGKRPKSFRLEKIDEFCAATGWTAVKVINTALQNTTKEDGTQCQVEWPDDIHMQMAAKLNRLSAPAISKLYPFMLDHVPQRFRCFVCECEGDRRLADLIDYKQQKCYSSSRILAAIKEENYTKEKPASVQLLNYTHMFIKHLPELVEQTGISPHLLLGLGDTPLLCKNTEVEHVMDAFTILNVDLQRTILKAM